MGRAEQPAGKGGQPWQGIGGRGPPGRAPGKLDVAHYEQRHQHAETASQPHPWPAHAQKAQAGKCALTDTHIHTRVRAWHRPGTTGTHLGTCTHGWTNRQQVSPLAVPPDICVRRGVRGSELPVRGAVLPVPLDTLAHCRLVPGGKPTVLLSTCHMWLLLAPPRPSFHHSWLCVRCTGFCGLPTAISSSCGIEFTQFALRVSMPSGGKYKRCLCLKPNMGVSESPGLCPSCRPGLWSQRAGQKREVDLHRTFNTAAVCCPRCPGCV
jgi:hypothetical protein